MRIRRGRNDLVSGYQRKGKGQVCGGSVTEVGLKSHGIIKAGERHHSISFLGKSIQVGGKDNQTS